jgi:site-specific DNA-methyltransferase (adenine-specific)
MPSKRKTTKTSTFGSPGRSGHDSSAFYAGKIYADQPQGQDVAYFENPIPADSLDQIFSHSAETMSELPDNSAHLMVTSPPYNVGKCYSEDTEVLTRKGWKFYPELSKDDFIATVNPTSFEVEYCTFDELYVYEHKGEMINFRKPRNSVNILVTPNHNVFCMPRTKSSNQRWQFIKASDVMKYNTVIFLNTIKWKGTDILTINIPVLTSSRYPNPKRNEYLLDANVFLEFLGYFISEGHLSSSQPGQYAVVISQKKYCEIIRDCLAKLPFNVYEFTDDDQITKFIITNKSLFTWLSENIGRKANDKKIPDFLKSLSWNHLKLLFDALIMGDGIYQSATFCRYSTSSRRLADDVQEIGFKLGFKAEIRKSLRREHYQYRIDIKIPNNQKNYCSPYLVTSKHINKVDYEGKVWCLNIKNHLFITRRDGCIAVQGNSYDKDQTLEDYLAFLQRVWKETWRVLVPGGRMCINVANLGRKPYIPLHAFISEQAIQLGFLMRGEIIWNKAASASPSTAWGSWKSASNPILRDVHEYILIFCKQSFKRQNPSKRLSTITRDEFLEYNKSVWDMNAESARRVGHPAPFPAELPRRLIQLYTFENEIVLDPFMGSGQTAIAAVKSGRHYVGYEIDEKYIALAEKRIKENTEGSDEDE